MNVEEAITFARQDAANASDAYEAAAHARAAVAAMPDKQRALRHARAACAAALGPLRSVAAWDAATYWDNVPEGFQAAHAAAAVLWAALDDCAGARLHVDVATICASSARCSGPARARRLAALRLVRGAGGSSVAHVAPWSHSNDVARPPQKKRRVVEPLVDSLEVVAARDFGPCLAPKRICDALVDSTLWPSVAALVKGFEDRHVPAERGQGADRRQEVVTLGALRDGVHCDADAPYVAQHRLFDQIPPLRDGLGAAFLGLAPRDAVAAIWAGPGGTATPAHYDPVDNVVGQFCGSKRWRLWRPSSGEPSGAPDYDAVVAPGDALFVPRGWWHRVDSLPCATGAVSVSLWFDDESGELPAFSNR